MPGEPSQQQTAPEAGSLEHLTNPERWVDEHADALFAFAALRVRDPSAARDLVQETFLAALRAASGYAGRSNERAWLFGILRNKLVDYYRLKVREARLTQDDSFNPEEGKFFQSQGLRKDAWKETLAPKAWAEPDESLVQKEFWRVLNRCLGRLPQKVAQVFVLREVDGLESEQICKELNLSANNFWVMSHRARLGLRRCLELHWFAEKKISDAGD